MSTVTVLEQVHTNPSLAVHSPSSVLPGQWEDAQRSIPTQQAGSTIDDALPRPGQRFFDVAPANILGKRRAIRRLRPERVIQLDSGTSTFDHSLPLGVLGRADKHQTISYGGGVVGGLKISEIYRVTGVHAIWVAASYPFVPVSLVLELIALAFLSLTQGTFVLVSGRLGAVFGHKNMLFLGGTVFAVSTLINGFVSNYIAFNAIRALSGIGGALILPNAVAMIAITNPPGRWRNLSLGFFGASAPIGGCIGGVFIGLLIKYSDVKWYFVGIATAAAAVLLCLWVLVPKEVPVDRHGKIDYTGAMPGTSALIIFN